MEKQVQIEYTNWRGERWFRNIVPKKLWYGSTEYHSEEQWLLDAIDVDKDTKRTFAMKDIHSWM